MSKLYEQLLEQISKNFNTFCKSPLNHRANIQGIKKTANFEREPLAP